MPLVGGLVAYVDEADVPLISGRKWRRSRSRGGPYAISGNGADLVYMHRVILGATLGVEVDHRDRDGLNNRRSNLRPATRQQNAANLGIYSTNTSGFRGVSFKRGRWRAQIVVNQRSIWLGAFADKIDAAQAYDRAALSFFGSFASLNFPDFQDRSAPSPSDAARLEPVTL